MSQDEYALTIHSPVSRVAFDNRGMITQGPDLTYEEFEMVCDALAMAHEESYMMFMWSWGDTLAYGEAKHGEKYAQAINRTGLALQSLSNYSWLAKATPRELRGLPNLGQSHYERVVKIKDYKIKRDLLQIASDEKWPAKTTLAKAVTALLGSGDDTGQRTGSHPGNTQDELDLAQQKQYMLEKKNIQLQLEQDLLQGQIGQAKEVLEPVLDQVAPDARLDIEKAINILRAEPDGEALALVKEIVHLYRRGDMPTLIDTLDKLSLLMED